MKPPLLRHFLKKQAQAGGFCYQCSLLERVLKAVSNSGYASLRLLMFSTTGSTLMFWIIGESQIGQVGVCSKTKLSLIQQEQFSFSQVQMDVSFSWTGSACFLEKYKAFPSFNKYGNCTKSGEYEKNCPYWSSFYSI